MMWITTGTGAAKNRAFSLVIGAPCASCDRRTAPATVGTRLNAMSAAEMNQSDLVDFMAMAPGLT
jgi:hypothetical protein